MSFSGLPPGLPNALQQQLLAIQQSQERMPMIQQNNLVSFDSQRSLTSSSSSSINNSRKATTLDTKLAILKSEMVSRKFMIFVF